MLQPCGLSISMGHAHHRLHLHGVLKIHVHAHAVEDTLVIVVRVGTNAFVSIVYVAASIDCFLCS